MANQKYQVPSIPAGDAGTGPRFDTDRINDGVDDIHRDKILIAQAGSLNVVAVVNATPGGADYGIVTRNIPSGTQNIADGGGSLTVDSPQLPTSLGQATAVNSLSVTLPSDQGALNVADGGGSLSVDAPVGTPVFSRLSDGTTALTTPGGRLSVDASGVAVPITDNAGSLTVDSAQLPTTLGQKTAANSTGVVIASDQGALPVASHAVTDGGSSLTVDSTQLPAALGQGTMAQSLPVTMASNQGAISVQGTTLAQVSGTIVNATSVAGGATDYSNVNNVTVTISGTYVGVNAAFEVSDNAGTTWFPIAGQRDDNAVAESSTGVLSANQSRSWVFSLLGYDRMRVRATAWTSGTANVRMSTASMPFEPVVSSVTNKPPSAISTNFLFSGAAVTAEALASLTPYRAGVAGGAGTSQAITAGKSFRLQAMTVGYRVGAAAVGGGIAYLRWLAGTVLVGSPILASVGASANAAVSGSGGGTTLTFGDGFDIPPGFSLGVTHIGHATTATITISVLGYEY